MFRILSDPSLLATGTKPERPSPKGFNPIHVNPYLSNLASLPGTIAHGMWTSSAGRKYLESVVAKGLPKRVKS